MRPAPGIFLYRLPPHFPLGFPSQKGRTSCLNFKPLSPDFVPGSMEMNSKLKTNNCGL